MHVATTLSLGAYWYVCLALASPLFLVFATRRFDTFTILCSLASSDFCALSLASRWLLKYVKYSAALNNAATASTNPHCFIPDMSLKFMAVSLGLAPVNFAGQLELERLHILYAVVLKRFFDLDVLEVPGLLQI